jgi:hypothetical protein
MRGYELSDLEWHSRCCRTNRAGYAGGRPAGSERDILGLADRRTVAGVAEGVSARKRPATTALCGGEEPGCGSAFWPPSQPLTTAMCR